MTKLHDALSALICGYTRLTCPHCPQEIRYRNVSPAEAERLRARMADHVASAHPDRTPA